MTNLIGYTITWFMAKVVKKEFEFWIEDESGNQQLLYWTAKPAI